MNSCSAGIDFELSKDVLSFDEQFCVRKGCGSLANIKVFANSNDRFLNAEMLSGVLCGGNARVSLIVKKCDCEGIDHYNLYFKIDGVGNYFDIGSLPVSLTSILEDDINSLKLLSFSIDRIMVADEIDKDRVMSLVDHECELNSISDSDFNCLIDNTRELLTSDLFVLKLLISIDKRAL